MASMIDDTNGQWILLSGLVISLSLVVVAILVNQSAITGYYSSYAALEFPKDKIRELTVQTHESVKSSAQLAWTLDHTSNESVLSNFTALLYNYSTQANMLFAAHGETINISFYKPPVFNSTTHRIEIVWLSIIYNNGITKFVSEPEIIEVK